MVGFIVVVVFKVVVAVVVEVDVVVEVVVVVATVVVDDVDVFEFISSLSAFFLFTSSFIDFLVVSCCRISRIENPGDFSPVISRDKELEINPASKLNGSLKLKIWEFVYPGFSVVVGMGGVVDDVGGVVVVDVVGLDLE